MNQKELFIRDMVLSNSISAAFGHVRGGVYGEGIDKPKQRKPLQTKIGKYLVEVGEQYDPTKDHYERIRNLKYKIENCTICSPLLRKGQISFGVTKKLVNLYLKYLWCLGKLGKIDTLPHCPVDAEILKKGEATEFGPWTKMDEGKYRDAIEKIKKTINSEDIALWELKEWNTKNKS